MKKYLIVLLMVVLPSLALAQKAGGHVTRPTKPATTNTKPPQNNSITNMKRGIYYMCIAWGQNLNWVKGVCKTWAEKGYKPNIVTFPKGKDEDDLYGYYVCIKQFSDKSSAERFAESCSDIVYIFYNYELLDYNRKKGVIE